jgi:cyclase
MSRVFRVISKLEIKNHNLVKGVGLEGLRALGNAEKFANFYYDQNIDEIFYQDIVASLYGQNNLLELIKTTANNIFVPLTVGGGIRTINDVYNILNSGADRICANSAFIKNKNFVKEVVREFGSSTICASIEAVKLENDYYCFYENGRSNSGIKVSDWIETLGENLVGEIFLTHVDLDGRGIGIDNELIDMIKNKNKVSIIYNGGIGKVDHIIELKKKFQNLSGVCLASLLHYNSYKNDFFLDELKLNKGNFSFFRNNNNFLNFEKINIKDLKSELSNQGIKVRL